MAVYRRTDSARSWRRRLQASIRLALTLLAAAAGTATAQPAAGDHAAAVATLDKFIAEVHSLTAEFRQEVKTDDEKLVDTGTLSFERPNRFRWMSRKPELIVVTDGKTMWQYDVELAQVTQAPLDASNDSSPASLLAGDRSARDRFDVLDAYPRDGLEWIKLAPKAADSGFASVLIGFEGLAPRRLELVDSLNHLTTVALEKVVLNPDLAASEFEFKAPPNVEVIGGER